MFKYNSNSFLSLRAKSCSGDPSQPYGSSHVRLKHRFRPTYLVPGKCTMPIPVVALRRGSAPARLLGLGARIPPRARTSVSCECCALSARGLCVGLITRLEESY